MPSRAATAYRDHTDTKNINRFFPIVIRLLKNQQEKKQNRDFSKEQKTTIDVKAREKK